MNQRELDVLNVIKRYDFGMTATQIARELNLVSYAFVVYPIKKLLKSGHIKKVRNYYVSTDKKISNRIISFDTIPHVKKQISVKNGAVSVGDVYKTQNATLRVLSVYKREDMCECLAKFDNIDGYFIVRYGLDRVSKQNFVKTIKTGIMVG